MILRWTLHLVSAWVIQVGNCCKKFLHCLWNYVIVLCVFTIYVAALLKEKVQSLYFIIQCIYTSHMIISSILRVCVGGVMLYLDVFHSVWASTEIHVYCSVLFTDGFLISTRTRGVYVPHWAWCLWCFLSCLYCYILRKESIQNHHISRPIPSLSPCSSRDVLKLRSCSLFQTTLGWP